jgi:hypothetical protein
MGTHCLGLDRGREHPPAPFPSAAIAGRSVPPWGTSRCCWEGARDRVVVFRPRRRSELLAVTRPPPPFVARALRGSTTDKKSLIGFPYVFATHCAPRIGVWSGEAGERCRQLWSPASGLCAAARLVEKRMVAGDRSWCCCQDR